MLHEVAGVGNEGRFLWSALESTASMAQPAPRPVVSVSAGQAAAAEAQPDSPLQAVVSMPAAASDATKRVAAAATPSGGQKQRRGFVDVALQDAVTQRNLMAWELKRPSVIPVAQQHAPDAVACWDVRSGDAPPCTSMPVHLVAAGAVVKGKPSTCHLAPRKWNQMQARVRGSTWEPLPQVWWTTSLRSSASCDST